MGPSRASRPPATLRPTLSHTRGAHYRRPGGPWDGHSLDAAVGGPAEVVDVAAGLRVSRAHLDDAVAHVAGALRRAGVRRADAVAWQLPNWWEALVLYRACWRLGAVAAPIHHGAGPADAHASLRAVGPRLVFSADGLPASETPGVVAVRGPGDGFAALLAAPPIGPSGAAGRSTDLAVVLFTSGSTGSPKGVLHTHRGLAWKARLMARVHGLRPDDTVLMPAPLAHVSGLLNGVLLPGAASMRAVLMDRWDPERALGLMTRERVSFMIGPPTFFVTLMAAPRFAPERVDALRLVSSGGAGVTPAFVRQASETLGCVVKRTYGSTEAPTVTTSWAGDPLDRARDTDGRATGEVELRICDPRTGRLVPSQAVGELLLRGPELFVGYTDSSLTAGAHARGGWFRTGDLGRIDAGGWLTVVGRLKDVIIRAGENISVAEVEAILEAHPVVRQAVAVGAPDERLGETVVAFVVTSAPFGREECRDWFRQQGVTTFKTPERVVRLEALPLLATGKPDRAALRRLAAGGREAD